MYNSLMRNVEDEGSTPSESTLLIFINLNLTTMELTCYEGCTNISLEIDNEDADYMKTDKLKEVMHKIVDTMSSMDLVSTITVFMQNKGEVTDTDYCEQCGDYNYTYKLKI